MAYAIEFDPKAFRDLKNLPHPIEKRIAAKIYDLSNNPRPPDVKKLKSSEGFLRTRAGDYRIVYLVRDKTRTVKIIRVRHRREVYRGL